MLGIIALMLGVHISAVPAPVIGAGRIMLFTWLNADVRRFVSFFSYADVRRAQNVPGRHQNGAGRTEIPLLFFPLR